LTDLYSEQFKQTEKQTNSTTSARYLHLGEFVHPKMCTKYSTYKMSYSLLSTA